MTSNRQYLMFAGAFFRISIWAIISTGAATAVEPIGANLTALGVDAKLQCVSSSNVTQWYRITANGTTVTIDQDPQKYAFGPNNTLTIFKVAAGDIGLYYCQVGTANATVALNSAPVLTPFGKSKNLVEGERLTLTCQPVAYPPATVTWIRKNVQSGYETDINTDSDPRSKVAALDSQANGSLTYDEMRIEDYMYYSCVADNGIGQSVTTTLVRVKDDLAPLWPFIGICIEVLLLVLVIVIYEKRRSKQEENECKDEAANLTNSTDHRSNDDVRSRKS